MWQRNNQNKEIEKENFFCLFIIEHKMWNVFGFDVQSVANVYPLMGFLSLSGAFMKSEVSLETKNKH